MLIGVFRAFLGIEIDNSSARNELDKLICQLKQKPEYAKISWNKIENLHITIKFLGNINQNQYTQLTANLSREFKIIKPFVIDFNEIFIFPKKEKPIALALKPVPQENLMRLHKIADQAAVECGLKVENKPFIPHLTLGKIKNHSLKNIERFPLPKLEYAVNKITFYQSNLLSDGASYNKLNLFSLY